MRRRRITENNRKDSVVVWEVLDHVDTITGRNGKGTILTLTEQTVDFIFMEKLGHGWKAAHAAKTAIRLLLSYWGDGVKTMTADNGGRFSVHGKITEAMKETAVCFANPCCLWEKGIIGNADKLIRQSVPRSTDFSNPDNSFPKKSTGQDKRKAKGETRFPNTET